MGPTYQSFEVILDQFLKNVEANLIKNLKLHGFFSSREAAKKFFFSSK